jgi:hypothetical protein
VHQQLPVRAQHVELADVAGEDRLALLGIELVVVQQLGQVLAEALLHRRVPVQVKEELLRRVEAHAAPHLGMW